MEIKVRPEFATQTSQNNVLKEIVLAILRAREVIHYNELERLKPNSFPTEIDNEWESRDLNLERIKGFQLSAETSLKKVRNAIDLLSRVMKMGKPYNVCLLCSDLFCWPKITNHWEESISDKKSNQIPCLKCLRVPGTDRARLQALIR